MINFKRTNPTKGQDTGDGEIKVPLIHKTNKIN